MVRSRGERYVRNQADALSVRPEHPEHPNNVDYEEHIEPNQVFFFVRAEHPVEPNDISAEENIDPNDIEKIILDEGIANLKATKPEIARSS